MKADGQLEGVAINKSIRIRYLPFKRVFRGFENVDAVKKLFGKHTKNVLSNLKVMLVPSKFGYLWIDDKKGALVCNYNYIKDADKRYVYLDVIHELVHIKQRQRFRIP